MDNAKFCRAVQGWSTSESMEPVVLLRRPPMTKQEEDHGVAPHAMALRPQRQPPGRGTSGFNRLMVKTGKTRMPPRFG
jgi:hypothetical protein